MLVNNKKLPNQFFAVVEYDLLRVRLDVAFPVQKQKTHPSDLIYKSSDTITDLRLID